MILHIPSALILIGYGAFWLEISIINSHFGATSPLAMSLAFAMVLYWVRLERVAISTSFKTLKRQYKVLSRAEKAFIGLAATFMSLYTLLALYAATFPPHLQAEFDALIYHYALPRQHLIRQSFSHISWSAADLWPLALQFSLAPYWFLTVLPNKFPQFLFLLGLWALVFKITYQLIRNKKQKLMGAVIATLALTGSHVFMVQYGTAQLDIPFCFLFLAGLDSVLNKRWGWAGFEWSVFFWGKSFIPIQFTLIVLCLLVLYVILRQKKWRLSWIYDEPVSVKKEELKKFVLWFGLFGLLFGGPFLAKSFYVSGTPLYPFGKSLMEDPQLKEFADLQMKTREHYGEGRSVLSFVKHFWTLAVPTKGVNNAFDYPVGLPFLVFLLPFFVLIYLLFKKKRLGLLPVVVILFWGSWWMGSQQSRWLYVPLSLLFISCATMEQVQKSWGIKMVLLLSLAITGLSFARSHKQDFGKSRVEVVRPGDKELIKMGRKYKHDQSVSIPLKIRDATYATFPVKITKGYSYFVLLED